MSLWIVVHERDQKKTNNGTISKGQPLNGEKALTIFENNNLTHAFRSLKIS